MPSHGGKGQPLSPWGRKALEAVQEGPQDYDALVSRLSSLVPPGRAYRHYLSTWTRARAIRGLPPVTDVEANKAKKGLIATGQRHIVLNTLRQFRKRNRIDYDLDNGRVITLGSDPILFPSRKSV